MRRTEQIADTLEKVLLEDIGLERRAGLARDDEQRASQIDFVFARLDLRRIGRVEDVEFRKRLDRAEGLLHHLGTQARTSHSKQHDVGHLRSSGGFSKLSKAVDVSELVVRDAKPAKPLCFVLAGPQ